MKNFPDHSIAKVTLSPLDWVRYRSFLGSNQNRREKHLGILDKELKFTTYKRALCLFGITLETHILMKPTLRPYISLVFTFCFAVLSFGQSSHQMVRITARNGDSGEKIMRRYKLLDHSCNEKAFYKINDLAFGDMLVKGKKYYLPILVFEYNGVSIRTSMDWDGWKKPLRIKEYNEYLKKRSLRSKSLVKSQLIWIPLHELDCILPENIEVKDKMVESEPEPEESTTETNIAASKDVAEEKLDVPEALLAKQKKVSGYRNFPIFGDKHANVPLIDNKLAGKIYYLVAGHGGPDPGAIGEATGRTLCEDEYSYDVTLRLCRKLLEHGATVYMITRDPDDGLRDGKFLECDNDEYCWGNKKMPLNQRKRLLQRASTINELYRANKSKGIKEQMAIMIHIDSRSKSANTDVFFYHYPRSGSSRSVAMDLHKTFKAKYGKYRRNGKYHGTVTGRDLFMLRVTQPKAVFIELGNIRSPKDQKRFLLESNREAVAKWLYEGLIRKK
ncbi:MAG: N-acetylmuramoyl-L-alanine amidase [Saprospiraceae bacterium]|nr:N-acetylmuramoyl-L-alanine amidase [Saprospiraceae bacterium]